MADGVEAFAHHLMRVVCAQIIYATAENVSSKKSLTKNAPKKQPVSASTISVTESVIDAFADVAEAFAEALSRTANNYTEHAGRTNSTTDDVFLAVEALSHSTHSTMKDLVKYAMFTEVPFPYQVPEFPAPPPPSKKPDDLYVTSEEHSEPIQRPYIEPWMPPLPSPHTYVATAVYSATNSKKKNAAEIGERRRAVEKSLAQLKEAQRKDDDSSLLAAVAAAVPDNPFLAPPMNGSGRIYDEDLADGPRDLIEDSYANNANTTTDSNMKDVSEIVSKTNASDQKKQRVERILAEAGNELEDPELMEPNP